MAGTLLGRAFQDDPDLVVLDIAMPGGDGHVVAERLRDNAKTASLPIVFMTGRTTVEDFERALASGVAKYITKPKGNPVLSIDTGRRVEFNPVAKAAEAFKEYKE